MPPRLLECASRTCASTGIAGWPSAPLRAKSGSSNSFSCPSGAPTRLGPADGRPAGPGGWCGPRPRCASGSGGRPGRSRRPSRRPRRHVAGRDPDVLVDGRRVLGLEVGGAVLEPEQVARAWPGSVLVDDVRPNPSWRPAHRRPPRSRAGRGCGPRARRPAGRWRRPGCRGRRRSGPGRGRRRGSAGRSCSAAGLRSASPNRSSNSDGAEAEGDGQPGRRQPDRPRRCPAGRRRGRRRRRRPARPRRRRSSARRRGSTSSAGRRAAARSLVTTSRATKCSRSWAGVTMPAWCAPRNGIGASRLAGAVAGAASAAGSGRRVRRIPAAEPDRDPGGRRSRGDAEQPAAAHAARGLGLGDGLGHDVGVPPAPASTTPGTLATCSESASRWTVSALTSVGRDRGERGVVGADPVLVQRPG